MKVLIAIEDVSTGQMLADFAAKTFQQTDVEFQVLHVIQPVTSYVTEGMVPELLDDIISESRCTGMSIVRKTALILKDQFHADNVKELVAEGYPQEEIVRIAKESDIDMIVVGSHGRNALAKFFLGSVSSAVVSHSPCPVLIVRTNINPSLKKSESEPTARSA